MFYKQSPQTRTRNESRGGIKPMFQRHCSQTRTLGREKRGEAESNQCFIDSAHKPEIWKRTEAESNQCSIDSVHKPELSKRKDTRSGIKPMFYRQCPQTRTLEEKGDPKWNQTNVLLLTGPIIPHRQAKPAHANMKVKTWCFYQARNDPLRFCTLAHQADNIEPDS